MYLTKLVLISNEYMYTWERFPRATDNTHIPTTHDYGRELDTIIIFRFILIRY